MNRFACALAVATLAVAAPVAAVTVPYAPSFTLTNASVGSSFTVGYTGWVNATNIPTLAANIKFTLLSQSGSTWNFKAEFDNDLPGSIDGRISTFGFNSDPNISSVTALTGPFNKGVLGTNVYNAGGVSTPIEFCLTAGPNCNAGGGGGVMANTDTAVQLFTLNYNPAVSSITLSNFVLRWQSITGLTQCGGSTDCTSGIGVGRDPYDPNTPFGVPEPSSWAMLIAGFGLVGAAARRRKARGLTVAA
jgi:hypothetical protein